MADSVDELDASLVAAIDSAGHEAAARAGAHLRCRLGCTECCHGPFPIDALDAHRLRRGFRRLQTRDPNRALAVLTRARDAVTRLLPDFPGEGDRGFLDDEAPRLEDYLGLHSGMPCPALDPSTGGCDLYGHRPLACRTFGPPVQLGDERLDPCHLCFVGADPHTLEACRSHPNLEPEAPAFAALAAEGFDADAETLIAFVLADWDELGGRRAPREEEVDTSPSARR